MSVHPRSLQDIPCLETLKCQNQQEILGLKSPVKSRCSKNAPKKVCAKQVFYRHQSASTNIIKKWCNLPSELHISVTPPIIDPNVPPKKTDFHKWASAHLATTKSPFLKSFSCGLTARIPDRPTVGKMCPLNKTDNTCVSKWQAIKVLFWCPPKSSMRFNKNGGALGSNSQTHIWKSSNVKVAVACSASLRRCCRREDLFFDFPNFRSTSQYHGWMKGSKTDQIPKKVRENLCMHSSVPRAETDALQTA